MLFGKRLLLFHRTSPGSEQPARISITLPVGLEITEAAALADILIAEFREPVEEVLLNLRKNLRGNPNEFFPVHELLFVRSPIPPLQANLPSLKVPRPNLQPDRDTLLPVSYTHLTLPTNREV